MSGPPTAGPDEVGSVGEEAVRLLLALGGSGAPASTDAHQCPHGWCPACQIATYLTDHPEIVASVTASATGVLRAVRDAFDTTPPRTEDPA